MIQITPRDTRGTDFTPHPHPLANLLDHPVTKMFKFPLGPCAFALNLNCEDTPCFAAKEDKQLQEAALAASARLKQALLKERQAKTALQRAASELQVNEDVYRCSVSFTGIS